MVCRCHTAKNKDLNFPINKLEKQKDNKKIWRKKLIQSLKLIIKKFLTLSIN